MLHINDEFIKEHLLDGAFGLEKENLRVLSDGSFSHTKHPAPGDDHIVRDFCENQIEINTDPYGSAEEAVAALRKQEKKILDLMSGLAEKEYLWLFSNPPYIKGEYDIPIADYTGEEAWKTEYRNYLSGVYGRYKMTFSGIHVNYSFSDDLLRREAELMNEAGSEAAFRKFKDDFYVSLTEKMSYCGWLLVALTAASPVIDGSFTGGEFDQTVNTGMASLRCSERGYWNFFEPVFDYTDLDKYADSIENYVKKGMLVASSELYYPVRLKPNSAYSVEKLREEGAGHIELRMFDLNPFAEEGVDIRDIKFAGYFLAYLASLGNLKLGDQDQKNVVRNFKQAARYDLDGIEVKGTCGTENIIDAAVGLIDTLSEFYASMLPDRKDIRDVMQFERVKFTDDQNRYAVKVLKEYGEDFVKKGIALMKERQSR